MPIYEYQCEDCNNCFESIVFGNEQPNCPSCNGENVNRLMSACSFFSKGSQGQTVKAPAGSSSCSGCAATSCSTCT